VRIPAPQFELHGSRTKGAIVAGDAELLIPPVLNLDVELGAPLFLNTNAPPLLDQNGSYNIENDASGAGALGAVSQALATATDGIWVFNFFYCFMFTGTTATLNFSGIRLSDAAGNSWNLVKVPFVTGIQQSGVRRFAVHLAYGGNHTITHIRSATVAGDTVASYVDVLAQKIAG